MNNSELAKSRKFSYITAPYTGDFTLIQKQAAIRNWVTALFSLLYYVNNTE